MRGAVTTSVAGTDKTLTGSESVHSMRLRLIKVKDEILETECGTVVEGERAFREEGRFRGCFFRKLVKEMLVPMVI